MTVTERERRRMELVDGNAHRTELCEQLAMREYELENLKEENAKLMEFATDLWRFTKTACERYPRLFDPPAQGGQMVRNNMLVDFELRSRELGIEVVA